jgi:sepiapterin reductase
MNSKVILITGAGKGIGEATVKSFLKHSKQDGMKFRFFLTSRTEADLKKLQGECVAQGAECEILPTDLSSDPASIVAKAIARFGQIDVLLHSAGVGRFGDFLTMTPEDVKFVVDTNITATFLLLQATYREMQKKKSGTLAIVTSVAGEKPFEHSSIYCMSKFAQKGLIDVMRLYGYRDGIRILDVKPGATHTPMWGEVSNDQQQKMMTAEEVAEITVSAILLPLRASENSGQSSGSLASVEEITIRPLRGDL